MCQPCQNIKSERMLAVRIAKKSFFSSCIVLKCGENGSTKSIEGNEKECESEKNERR